MGFFWLIIILIKSKAVAGQINEIIEIHDTSVLFQLHGYAKPVRFSNNRTDISKSLKKIFRLILSNIIKSST